MALARFDAGARRRVDAPDVDSCHRVWIQFHEDLLATLGVPRGSDTRSRGRTGDRRALDVDVRIIRATPAER